MTKQVKWLWLVLAVIMTASTALANDENPYLRNSEIPNALIYLPSITDSTIIATNGDYAWWIWGKTMRNTPRGEQASWESKFGIVRMCTIYSDVLGIDITEENTPAIYQLLKRSGETGTASVTKIKGTYFRKRPFLIMNEDPWGQYDSYNELEKSSSYPSSHTSFGWGSALALAEMAPHMQDTILRRGYEYGISRVIVGAHWRSDVDAAIICASTTFARSHGSQEFASDMQAAKQEYMRITGLSESQITNEASPSIAKILDPPLLPDTYQYYGDITPYWQAKTERDSLRGEQAVADACLEDDVIISGFAQSAGIDISSSATPRIKSLIVTLKSMFGDYAVSMKDYWYRNRPYVHLGDTTSVPDDEDTYSNESSYPSRHALIGWGIALVLAEVMPDRQDNILKRGYDFAWSRVITGFQYPSDVQAGCVMAACFLAKLHNDPKFNNLLNSAMQEYASLNQ